MPRKPVPSAPKSANNNETVNAPQVNETDNTPEINEENTVTENFDLSPEETVNGEVMPEVNGTDNPDDVNDADNGEESDAVDADKPEVNTNPWVAIEDIPDFGNAVAGVLAMQTVTFRNSYIEAYNAIQIGTFDETGDGVIAVADTLAKQGNEAIKETLLKISEMRKYLDTLMAQLTTEVKADPTMNVKTPEEIASLKAHVKDQKDQINNSLAGMHKFEAQNPGASIKPAIEWLENLPPLPGGKTGTVKIAGSSGKSSGISRPRLGSGYVQVNGGKKHGTIGEALKEIKEKSGNTRLIAGDVTEAWVTAAGKNEWSEVPVNVETTFDIAEGVKVTIKRTADQPKAEKAA